MLYNHVTELIGNTPLLRLDPQVHGIPGLELYAKLEYLNPFGSVKDRIAWGMIRDHVTDLVAGRKTLIEASSGNTAKALQVLASVHGLDLKVLTNRVKVGEVRDVLLLLGTDLEELPGLSECPDPTVPNDVFSTIATIIASEPGRYFHTSQYTNPDNVTTHQDTTGREIAADIGGIDLLVGGLGTTGSTRGTATQLKMLNPAMQTIGVVSTTEDFIPGIRSEAEMWEVGLFEPGFYDQIVAIRSTEAIDATLDLVRHHGLLVGPTSGAAYAALREHLRCNPIPEGAGCSAVMIVCDRIEWYLSYLRSRRPELFGQKPRARPADLTEAEVASAPVVRVDELTSWLGDPDVVRVDTRGAMAYRIGHVPGAINLRDDLLEDLLTQGSPFPASSRLVFICPIGEYSRRIAAFLTQRGHRAYSLDGGIVAWRDAGHALETGTR